jgi:hypothetical protein
VAKDKKIMAIDMEKMRAKLASLKGEGSNGNSAFWKPNEGTQDIRIVPTQDGDPLKEMWFHYNLGKNRGFLCPKKNYGDRCPVCDFASQLWREGVDNDDFESKKLAKSLFSRQRFFSPVVVRGEEEAGARIWGYGKTAYELLLGYILDPDYGDITDIESGTDITLTYTKPSKPGAYPQTTLKPRRHTSPLLEDSERVPGVLDNIPEFSTLFDRQTTQDVENMLDAFLSDDESTESRSHETVLYNNSAKNEVNSVDAAFNELLGK